MATRRLRAALLTPSALALAWMLPAAPSQAQDATWLASPGSVGYIDGANWDTGTMPTGTAYFGATNTSNLVISSASTIGGWTFNAGAPAYTFDNYNWAIGFNGAGIAVNGGSVAITNTHFGTVTFYNSSTAGSATITNNSYGFTSFYDTSSAGSASIINHSGGSLSFYNSSTAGGASITNSGVVSFSNSSTAGTAVITGGGTLIFQDSSTAGSASITANGGVYFRNTSTAGSASITIAHWLYFNDNSTAGSAALLINAGGRVDFSNTSGLNGDNKVSAGSIAGGGTFYLGADELTTGSNNLSTEVGGVIADGGNIGGTGGALVKIGIGTLTLSGANTYTGGTTINSGTLQLGSAGGIGSILGTVTVGSGATFDVVNADTSGITGISNSGATNFRNSTSAGSATVVNNGNLVFYNTSTAGSARVTNNDQMRFTGTSTAGNASITNNHQLTFDSSATAGSATVTNNNQLAFDTNATAGSVLIMNVGHTQFSGSSTAGNAQLFNASAGSVFDLSMTSGPNGDHKLTAGSLLGGGTFYLGANELTVGSNNLSTEVTGVIADGGSGGGTGASLVKVGTGRLTLSGVDTYTGATTVNGGTLAVNGDISASSGVTVNSGGILGGTGIVGNTTIASGGSLAPGNSIGTLTVSGNLTFSSGSSYTVEVSTTAADRTNVTGTATLTGAMVQAVAIPGSFRGQTFTLLNASGGLGGTQFAGLSVSGTFSPARNPHLTYDTNNVYLVLDPGKLVLPPGASGNQTSVAGGINNAVDSGAAPPAGFDTLLNMSGAQLNRALSQVSGQPGAAGTQAAFNAMQQFLGMLDPFNGGTDGGRGTDAADGGALGYAATGESEARVREAYAAVTPREASADVVDRRWGVWASGYGGASTLNGNAAAGSSSTTSRIYGTAVGADYRLSPDTLLGFALGGAGFNFSVADALGSGRADVFQAGLYARHNFGSAYISAALAYGWQDVTTDRTVTVSGTDKLTANFKASTFAGRLEAGWRFAPVPASSFGVTPYAAVQATSFHLPGYGETALVGSNQFALSYTSQDTTNVRTELGARTDQRFLVDDGLLTLRGRLAWAHDSNTNRFVNAAFQTLPGAAFTVGGAQPAADSALVGGRAEMKWRNGLTLAGTVEGEFSQSTQTYTGKGTVRYEW
ncbi:autotransporter domain-containing protein [Bradyrhizobium liaoningense]|uniref:autotransporter domain-containing protein n=1 Tax=Bradyrhizobium liaoningense TaxID=43992 RepID=UPI001BA7E2EB|nr:autotransporter domain-containing protein [Bradyrhizobium liaoningense]MBR0845927.1 autotransporter domain-containing protein [Bradyrhizobium liaoningense]